MTRDAAGFAGDVGPGANSDDFASSNAGAGSEIDDVVGSTHRLFIMLDHDDRVSLVSQSMKSFEKSAVVARVKTDGGFVKHVEHADQSAADLTGQANPLSFSSRKSVRAAVERDTANRRFRETQDVLGFP